MEKTNKNASRSASISLARLVAMCFIVSCHFFQYYDNELAWWFNVGVQVFFFISGFLYANKEIKSPIDFIAKNGKKILVPYYCFLLPAILIYFIFARGHISISSAVKAVLCSGTIDGIGHLWFISYILFCYIITPFLYDLFKKIMEYKFIYTVVFFAVLLLVGQAVFSAFDVYFIFSRIACFISGYYLSLILKKYGFDRFKLLSLLIIVASIIANGVRIYCKYFGNYLFTGFTFFEQYAHLLLGISIFLVVFICFNGIKYNKILKLSDKYSYYVYIVHQLFILSPFSLMAVTEIKYINWLVVIIAILTLAVVLKIFSDNTERFLMKKSKEN